MCRGAASIDAVDYDTLVSSSDNRNLSSSCVSIRCQGYETSLAECEIYDKVNTTGRKVAAATCYKETPQGMFRICDTLWLQFILRRAKLQQKSC